MCPMVRYRRLAASEAISGRAGCRVGTSLVMLNPEHKSACNHAAENIVMIDSYILPV
jgi:hypothetical protein